MDQEITVESVKLQPIELMKEAKELVGEQYWLFVGLCLVAILIGTAVPLGILLGPMLCGLYLCYMARRSQTPTDFNTLFKGFEHFKEALIATLIVVAIVMVIMIPVYFLFIAVFMGAMIAFVEDAPALAIGIGVLSYLLMFLVIILIHVPFTFVYPLIVGHGLAAVPAIKASWKGVKQNLAGVTGMVVAFTLITMLASLCCYLPAFLVIPLTFGGTFLAYTRVFPLEKSLKPAMDPASETA